ncbi:MAG TPA: hypothetical protein DEP53_15985 [Bacteroidetes bacterium]|nr:MAG: hypothetical protein A2X66_09110 [Ignavibacteria bacterium GWA2_54_16]HCA81232.1 hypothetical protein [Bacteroidota bacterium]
MSITQAFLNGVRRAASEPKMIFVLYLMNLLLAVPLALAIRSVMITGFGDSLAPAQMMGSLDFTVFQDFLNLHDANLQTVLGQVLSVLVLSMLLQTFLAGGILAVLQDQQKKYSSPSFFKGCGTYFFRFLRLFLLFGVILIVAALVLGGIATALAEGMTENATSEVTEFWIRIAVFVLFLLPMMLVLMAADYAKIHMVLHDGLSAFRSCGEGFAFVFRRFFSTFGLEILMLLIPILSFAVYIWLDLAIGMTTTMTILVMFFIQQMFMILRAWTRIFILAGEITLYRGLQRKPFPEVDAPSVAPEMQKA